MLTRDEIMSMQAGRELDALIAEHVMGLHFDTDPEHPQDKIWMDANGGYVCNAQMYYHQFSQDIRDAWRVVEKITAPPATYEEAERMSNTKFCNWFDHANLWALSASEAAFAICQAALMTTIR